MEHYASLTCDSQKALEIDWLGPDSKNSIFLQIVGANFFTFFARLQVVDFNPIGLMF